MHIKSISSFAHVTFKAFIALPRRPLSVIGSAYLFQGSSAGSKSHTYEKTGYLSFGWMTVITALGLFVSNKATCAKSEEEEEFSSYVPTVDLEKFGGDPELIRSVSDYVVYLQNPEKFTKDEKKAPKGLLLSGPPGVGKSFLAEAIAGHAGAKFFMIAAGSLQRKYVGETDQLVRGIFKAAESAAPAVICIDEIESIIPKRFDQTSTTGFHINASVNQLLTLLTQERKGVVVIGTTNNVEVLDPAAIRPGRFDRRISLSLPSSSIRKQILEIHLKGISLNPELTVADLVTISEGFSGAKLVSWVNEAEGIAQKKSKRAPLTLKDFDEARDMVNFGVLTSSNLSPKEKEVVAAHESGHAIVGHVLYRKFHKISLCGTGDIKGYIEWRHVKDGIHENSKQALLDRICVCLAGRAGELLYGSAYIGSKSDLEEAKKIALLMVEDEGMGSTLTGSMADVNKILEGELRRAIDILTVNEFEWRKISDALTQRNTLFYPEFAALLRGEDLPPVTSITEAEDKGVILPKKLIRKVYKNNIEEFSSEEIAKRLRLPEDSIKDIVAAYGVSINLHRVLSDSERLAIINSLKILGITVAILTHGKDIYIFEDLRTKFISWLNE